MDLEFTDRCAAPHRLCSCATGLDGLPARILGVVQLRGVAEAVRSCPCCAALQGQKIQPSGAEPVVPTTLIHNLIVRLLSANLPRILCHAGRSMSTPTFPSLPAFGLTPARRCRHLPCAEPDSLTYRKTLLSGFGRANSCNARCVQVARKRTDAGYSSALLDSFCTGRAAALRTMPAASLINGL